MQPPAAPADAGQASAVQAGAAPLQPRPAAPARPAEARLREPSASVLGTPFARAARRATETPDARPIEPRERAVANRREPTYAPPFYAPPATALPEWQPPGPAAPWARKGEERSIIGTYTTDQNGVRTFRSAQ